MRADLATGGRAGVVGCPHRRRRSTAHWMVMVGLGLCCWLLLIDGARSQLVINVQNQVCMHTDTRTHTHTLPTISCSVVPVGVQQLRAT